jgi:DNA-binding CsgD family transcriptional regulator
VTLRSSDLVERDGQLAALRVCAATAAAGTGGRVALVSGEAGIGKTSLVSAFAAEHPSYSTWWGACDALMTPNPLAPLHDIARGAPVGFAKLLAENVSTHALFGAVIGELQKAGPTIVVIEDAHWADQSTLDLALFIGRRIDRTKAVLVITYRADEISLSHPLRAIVGGLPSAVTEHIELPRLSEAAVGTLARKALRPATGIHAASGGNPFFVTELLRHGSSQTPRSVQDLVLGRLARLSPSAREIVQLAAIVPARIERWLVEELLHPATHDLEACLDSGLLVAQPAWLAFRHELARVAVEGATSATMSESLHARALDALRSRPDTARSLSRLVHHAVRAHRNEAVLELAPQAAAEARARGARREAASHFRTALEVKATIELLEAYAIECRATHQISEAIRAREEIAKLLVTPARLVTPAKAGAQPEAEAIARNLSQLALDYVVGLRNADADASNRPAIDLLEKLPPGLALANAYRVEAQLRMLNRDVDEAIEWGNKATALALQLGDQETYAAGIGTVGAATSFIDWPKAHETMKRAIEISLEHGYDYIAANNYVNIGSAAGELYHLDTADEYLQRAIQFSTTREVDFYRHYAFAWLAICDVLRGRWDEAETHAVEALAGAEESSTARVMALVALGRLRARRGDEGVDEVLDEALQLAEESGTLQRIAPVREARAEAAFLRGDLERVKEEAKAALPLAIEKNHRWHIGELSYWSSRTPPLPPSSRTPQRGNDPGSIPPRGPGEYGTPYDYTNWKDSASMWQSLGCPYEQARSLAEGDDEAKLQALAIFERLGARPAAQALRKDLRDTGVKGVPRGPRASTQKNPAGLTAREVEVLELIRLGLRNSEIAERLFRSVRTIEHHVDAILGKLEVKSRGELRSVIPVETGIQSEANAKLGTARSKKR